MKISEGIGLGIGVGMCALAGYAIYRLFFAKSAYEVWLESIINRTGSDLQDELNKIYSGQPITDREVEIVEKMYQPILQSLNDQISIYDRDAVVALPSDYDTLSNEEKVIYNKASVLSAAQKLAYLGGWKNIFDYGIEFIRTLGVWLLIPGAGLYALFKYGQIRELIRRIKHWVTPPKGRKIFEIYDHNGNPLDAKISVDGTVYSTTNGVLSLDLSVGKHVITIVAEGFKVIQDVIEVVEGTKINTYQPEPIVNPVTGEPLPDEDPQETVDTLPLDILSLLAEWTGTTVEWLKQNAYCAAMVALAAAVVIGAALFSRNPMATESAAACVLPLLAPCGIYKTEDEVIKDASPELFQRLKEEGWIVV